jgi:tetratricopeptide (TPR) repeat protein
MPPEITPDFINTILAQPTPQEQLAVVAATQLLNAAGVAALLDVVETRAKADPKQAFELVELCQLAANSAGIVPAQARAAYLRGQLHAMRGEFDAALAMIDAARTGYDQLGMALESLSTNVGLMRVLGETGQYDKALAVGQHVLDVLGDSITNAATNNTIAGSAQRNLLAAYVHCNNGLCYTFMGRFADALRAYTNAEPLYRGLAQSERLADLRSNQGLVFVQLGRGQDALLAYAEALEL